MKINDRNLAAFATSGEQIDREGYLMKLGDGYKNFCKRWFVLKGNLLFYFEKKTDRDPLGLIILEGSTIELAESNMEEHFCFKIVFSSKSYILGADSQESLEQWMKALACATYDYIKLMASELQRQLDELCKEKSIQESQTLEPASKTVAQSSASEKVPTPPQRTKNSRSVRNARKKTFASIHEEFGLKILADQKARWEKEAEQLL